MAVRIGACRRQKMRKITILCLASIAFLMKFVFYENYLKLSFHGASAKTDPSVITLLNSNRTFRIWPQNDYDHAPDRVIQQTDFASQLSELGRVNDKKLKVIYHLTDPNYGPPPLEGQHVFFHKKCPIKACSITNNMKQYKDSDAAVMESFQLIYLEWMLPKPKNQVWVVSGGESPPMNNNIGLLDTHALNGLVNWTMFYRWDSTVPNPYGRFQIFSNFTRIEDYQVKNGVNYANGKTKKVAWLVSNCNRSINSGRQMYADQLAQYIDVDVYGKCGNLECPMSDMVKCHEMLRRDYKFYLSFENNNCKHYITEKFFNNALQNDVLPIVLGAPPGDYEAVAPPGSYINVDDYDSPEDLAKYLHILDKNDTLYNQYFRWKQTGRLLETSEWSHPWCRLCALLHANDDGSYVHSYADFHKWWEEVACLERPQNGDWQSWSRRRKEFWRSIDNVQD